MNREHERRTGSRPGSLSAAACLVWALAVAAALVGCGGSTDPDGGDGEIVISFRPVEQGQQINLAQTIEFSVSATEVDTVAVNWWRDGAILSNAMRYTYVPSRLGIDTLRVQAAAGEVQRAYYWVIDVSSTGSTLPPAVPGLEAHAGPAPGDVAVTWTRVSSATYPLDEYVVAVSFDGPITGANWGAATELRRVTHRVGQVGYEAVFTVADDGMVPGAEAWFAVRAVDELGQMSPVESNGFTTITTAWWLTGTVVDDTGAVLPGVVVSSVSPVVSTNTDLAGTFRLGPLRSIDQVVIQTTSSSENGFGWYDFRSTAIDSIIGRDYTVRLIKRHVMDPACNLYENQFLNYMRFMSLTQFDAADPNSARLYRWPDYPLAVHVPDVVADGGFNLGDAMRFAMAYWDSVMGEPYFTEVATPAEAQLVCRFDESIDGLYGRVTLLAPGGSGVDLGDVVPEQMQVYVRSDIMIERFAREVSLHELGHTLGLYNHSSCSESDYLMVEGIGGNLDRPDPIHPNEQQAIRCIRRLDQGVDMRQYLLVK